MSPRYLSLENPWESMDSSSDSGSSGFPASAWPGSWTLYSVWLLMIDGLERSSRMKLHDSRPDIIIDWRDWNSFDGVSSNYYQLNEQMSSLRRWFIELNSFQWSVLKNVSEIGLDEPRISDLSSKSRLGLVAIDSIYHCETVDICRTRALWLMFRDIVFVEAQEHSSRSSKSH